ncbi:MAG: tail fiber domain-containing protein [Saprospiraceae bacterium]
MKKIFLLLFFAMVMTLANAQNLTVKKNPNGDILVQPLNTSSSIFFGQDAGAVNTGGNNTAVGSFALSTNLTGSYNAAIGADALKVSIGSSNLAAGYGSLNHNTTGFSNVAIGMKALFQNSTRSNLVAIGDSALYNNETGATTSFDGIQNTAVGSKALLNNTIGAYNTALGYQTLKSNLIGNYNTAIGKEALKLNTGSSNTAIGTFSMLNNTGGSSNTAVGQDALNTNSSGNFNSAFGYEALKDNAGGASNSAFGHDALFLNSSGNNNVAIGENAGYTGSGTGNVFLGSNAGYNETGSNKLYIVNSNDNANNALIYGEFDTKILRVNGNIGVRHSPDVYTLSVYHDNASHLGLQIQNSLSGSSAWELYQNGLVHGSLLLYTAAGTNVGSFDYNSGIYSATSDRRLKENIQTLTSVLPDVLKLEAKSYTYIADPEHKSCIGFIAQDVETIFPQLVTPPSTKGGRETNYTMNYSGFGVLAIEAIQEQQKIIESQQMINEAQEARIATLEAAVAKLMARTEATVKE